jgi:hypothetical protein
MVAWWGYAQWCGACGAAGTLMACPAASGITVVPVAAPSDDRSSLHTTDTPITVPYVVPPPPVAAVPSLHSLFSEPVLKGTRTVSASGSREHGCVVAGRLEVFWVSGCVRKGPPPRPSSR